MDTVHTRCDSEVTEIAINKHHGNLASQLYTKDEQI